MRGGIEQGITVFVPGFFYLKMHGRVSDPGMRLYAPRMALTPRTPANQQSASEVGVSTPCGAVSTLETTAVFVPGVCWSSRCTVSDSGMDRYPPQARRNLDASRRGNSRCTRPLAEDGRGGLLDQWHRGS